MPTEQKRMLILNFLPTDCLGEKAWYMSVAVDLFAESFPQLAAGDTDSVIK